MSHITLKTSDFSYELPSELIAQTPVSPRDSSRMLVYDRKTDEILDKRFYDVIDFLRSGDVLVINSTKVLPARLYGIKSSTGARVEFLLHKRNNLNEWQVLCKPAKKAKVGEVFEFSKTLKCEILQALDDGIRNVKFEYEGVFENEIEQVGEMPLPPYIRKKLSKNNTNRYQTVYAKTNGSSAAPTAGLHFTKELLDKIKSKGVIIAEVLLHVGLGTFRPVKAKNVSDHVMHSEYYSVSENTAEIINSAKREGRRVICVGTTSVRTLESTVDESGKIVALSGETKIFIYPPYKFKIVDALITNFHLPESTLIMLVSAFIGRENALKVYNHAVDEKYRFFSFGDACLFL